MLSAQVQINQIQNLSYTQLIEILQQPNQPFADDLIAMEMNRRNELFQLFQEQVRLKQPTRFRQVKKIIKELIQMVQQQTDLPIQWCTMEGFQHYCGIEDLLLK